MHRVNRRIPMRIRLTNAFSKKVDNLTAAVSLFFMYYNFGRVHQSLGKHLRPRLDVRGDRRIA